MLFSQSCTGSQNVLPGLSSEMFPTSSDGACNVSNVEVEEDAVVTEEGLIAVNKEAAVRIKQEDAEDICFPDIKSEPDEVSYVFLCLIFVTFSSVFVLYCQLFLFNATAPLLGIFYICLLFFLG